MAAKYIMNYLALVSGGGGKAQEVKEVIIGNNIDGNYLINQLPA